MKKKIVIILLVVTVTVVMLCFMLNYTNNSKSQGGTSKKVGTSNKATTNLQIKIINEYINIRKEPSVNSEILGIVKKGSLFNVIDYKEKGEYFWVHIKTNNNIEGYVATFVDDTYYEFVNGDIDYIKPTLTLTTNNFGVESASSVTEEYIKSLITYSDDKDTNPKLTYEITNSTSYMDIKYKVEDKSGNSAEKQIRVNVTKERLASNGKWITYDKVRELRNKFVKIANKYGHADDYYVAINTYWRMDFGKVTTIKVFTDTAWYHGCDYYATEDNIEAKACNDQAGEVSYDKMKNKLSSKEKSAKNAYLNIKKEFEKTGFKIEDMFLTF